MRLKRAAASASNCAVMDFARSFTIGALGIVLAASSYGDFPREEEIVE